MRRKTAVVAVAAMIGLPALAGCSSFSAKSSPDQCAVVVGNGIGDHREVKKVLLPGENVVKGDDDAYYFPCNARNYIITSDSDAGDSHKLVVARTADGTDVNNTPIPGTPVTLQVTAYWTLNQDRTVLKDFYAFCRKYSCATSSPAGNNSANFSSPGWNGMLRESFPYAIQRAASTVMRQFPPDVWNDPSQWQKIADALSEPFMAQIKDATGTSDNFFCASGSASDCKPVRFSVESVQAPAAVVNLVNQQINIQRQAANQIAQVKAQEQVLAEKKQLAQDQSRLYAEPGYAKERQYETLLSAISECKAAGGTCIINLGGGDTGVSVNGR